MRIARWALVLLVASSASAGPAKGDDIAKLEQELTALQVKQAFIPAVKVEEKLLALEIKKFGPESPEVARRKNHLAADYGLVGDYEHAGRLYSEGIAYQEKTHGVDSAEVYNALLISLSAESFAGHRDELDRRWQRIVALAKKLKGEDSIEYGRQLMSYGMELSQRFEYTAAQRLLEQGMKIIEAKATPSDWELTTGLNNLGNFYYWSIADKPRAIKLYERVVKIYESDPKGNPLQVGGQLIAIAAMYHWDNRDDLAHPLMRKVIAIYDKQIAQLEKDKPNDMMLASYYTMSASLAQQVGDLADADRRINRAIALDKTGMNAIPIAFAQSAVRRAQGRAAEARAVLETAKKAVAGKQLLQQTIYDSTIAEIDRDLHDYKHGEQTMLGYLAALEKMWGRKHPYYGMSELSLAYMYMGSGDLAKAVRTLTDSYDIAEKDLQIVLQTGTEADHTRYFSTNAYRLDVAVNFNYQLAPKDPAVSRLALTTLLRRKGRALDASAAVMATVRKKLAPEDKKLLDDLATARNKLAKLTVAGPNAAGDPAEYGKLLAALEDEVQRLELKIGQKSAAYRAATASIDLAPIQKLIPKDSRLVELVNFQPNDARKVWKPGQQQPARRYAAYVVGPTGDPTFVDLGPAPEIEAAIESFRKALSTPKSNVADVGRALYALTFGKLKAALGSSTDILIAPDGALAVVPFAALVDDKNKFLIDTYNFTYLTSGRDLMRLQVQSKAQGGGVIFANPAFDAKPKGAAGGGSRGSRSVELSELSWPALPGTGQEGAAVAKTLPGLKLVTGDAATETAVKQLHGPKILHLATHGFFLPDEPKPQQHDGAAPEGAAENPLLRSGLALAGANTLSSGADDGILTALEASGLDLEGTKLVVLSACETGVGKISNGDGVYGLRRALIIAGAQSLVMSLWQVDDAGTRDLMVGYYKRLAEGHGRSTALREVQLEMAASAKYKHPYYWAAFLPAGANTPIGD